MKARTAIGLVVACAAIALSVSAYAAPLEPQMLMLQKLTTEINTWNLVNELNLSQEQMQALLPLARELRSENERFDANMQNGMPEFERAIRVLHQEVVANSGVSDEAKQAVYRAEAPWKDIDKRVDARVPRGMRTILQVLTPEQTARLAAYRPGGGLQAAPPRALAKAEQLLVRARQASPAQIQQVAQRMGQRGIEGVPPEAASQLRDIVMRAREMSDADFQAHKAELAQQLVRLRPRAAVAGRDPQIETDLQAKTSRVLLNPALATVLEAKLGIAKPGPVPAPVIYPAQLDSMVTDIRVLNLVNSLYLSREQMTELCDIIARAEGTRDTTNTQIGAGLSQLITAANTVRNDLIAGSVTDSTWGTVRTGAGDAVALRRKYDHALAPYVAEVKRVLDENQQVLVAEFVPCLVPIKNLTNPERIGQADNTEGAERILLRARTATDDQVALGILVAQRRLEAALLHKHLPTAEIKAKVDDVPRVVAEARALSDAEFEIKKTELAKRIMPPDVPAVHGAAFDQRIAQYLLNPNLLPILQARLAEQKVASR